MGPAALVVSLVALLLSISVWFSVVGAPVGALAFAMGCLAIRRARRGHTRSWSGLASLVPSALAVLALPFFLWACNAWLICV